MKASSASVARPFVALLERQGADPQSLLQGVGLAPDLLDRPEKLVEERRLYHLLARAAAELDQPIYGLLVGDHSELRDIGSFGAQLEQSVTLFDLLSTFTRTVSAVSSHARFWAAAEEDEVWFCRAGIELLDVGEHQAELFVLGLMTQIVRLAAGPEWTPERIRLKRRRTVLASRSSRPTRARRSSSRSRARRSHSRPPCSSSPSSGAQAPPSWTG